MSLRLATKRPVRSSFWALPATSFFLSFSALLSASVRGTAVPQVDAPTLGASGRSPVFDDLSAEPVSLSPL